MTSSRPTPGITPAPRPFLIEPAATHILADTAGYRDRFDVLPVMVLDDVIAPPVIAGLAARGESARFAPHTLGAVGVREIDDDGTIATALAVLLDRAPLRDWLSDVARLPPLRGVQGSFAQARAGSGEGLAWHDDMNDSRRKLGIVVNLTSAPYSGGVFEMRRKGSGEMLLSHHHDRPGSTLIFAIGPDLEHRVTPVTSGGPRRVFAGWILSAENEAASRI